MMLLPYLQYVWVETDEPSVFLKILNTILHKKYKLLSHTKYELLEFISGYYLLWRTKKAYKELI